MSESFAINLLFFVFGILSVLIPSKFIPAMKQFYWRYKDWLRS